MNHLFTSGILFAQEMDRFRNMGSGLTGEGAKIDAREIISLVVVLLAVVAFVIVLARSLAKQDRRAKYNSPKALFRSLCQAHELPRADQRLLKQMARDRKLAHPAQVFLEPAWFEPAKLSPSLRQRAPQVAAVARRIFAEPPANASVAKEAAAVDAIIDV